MWVQSRCIPTDNRAHLDKGRISIDDSKKGWDRSTDSTMQNKDFSSSTTYNYYVKR